MVMDVNEHASNSTELGLTSIRCAANCFYNDNCIGFNLPNCELILDSMVYQTQTRDCENCKYYEMTCNELCQRHSFAFVDYELPNYYISSCDCIINASSANTSNAVPARSLTPISEISSTQTSTSFAITMSQIFTVSPNTFSSSSTTHGSSTTFAMGTDASTSANLSSSTDISTTAITLPSTSDNSNGENQLSSTLTTATLTPTIPSISTTMTADTTGSTSTTVTGPTTHTTVTIPTTETTVPTLTTSTAVTTPSISTTATTSTTSTTVTTSTTRTTTMPTTTSVAPDNFFILPSKSDMWKSQSNCNNVSHASLTLIKTTTRQTELANYIQTKGSAGNGYWIGVRGTSIGGTWVNEDNSSLSANFQPWASGTPPSPSYSCGRVYIKYEQPTKWYCDGAMNQQYCICDKSI